MFISVNFLFCFLNFLIIIHGFIKTKKLSDVQEGSCDKPVTIIFSAKDEQNDIQRAVESFLNLDYPNYSILAVNDRSSDNTGHILDELAKKHPKLSVLHVHELPQGWMGKNHALFKAVQMVHSDLILFTDADVLLHPKALSKAVHYFESKNLDYLPIIPKVTSKSKGLQMMLNYFSFHFSIIFRPWNANTKDKTSFLGIGAFGLIKKSAYLAVGGHEALKLRPDEDLRLGQRLKHKGYKLDTLLGQSQVCVDWYQSLKELFFGLEKNIFAGFDYSVSKTMAALLVIVLIEIIPFALVVFKPNAWLFLALCILLISTTLNAIKLGIPLWTNLFFPLSACIFTPIIFNSMYKTLTQNGVYWRGTFYPLEMLKKNSYLK